MFFDDRLATVLRHRADGEAAARTQFRQLLDLLGHENASLPSNRDESLAAAAWLRLGALAELIPVRERADIVRETGWRLRNPELVAFLAEDEPEVASAAIARAQLSEDNWLALIPHLPIRARGFLRNQQNLTPGTEAMLEQLGVQDRGLPFPDHAELNIKVSDKDTTAAQTALAERDGRTPAAEGAPEQGGPAQTAKSSENSPRPAASELEKSEIAELVERIAQFRKDREPASTPSESSPRLPLEEPTTAKSKTPRGFSFAADTAGRIEWAEPHVAAMVIGKRLVAPRQLGAAAIETAQSEIKARDMAAYAFTRHQPVKGAVLNFEGAAAIAGDWVVDAQPRFARSGGRFHGYVGRMRRPFVIAESGPASEADRVRQLLHELRTPVNALQGFAEIIQQQLFGPAPNEYRALAANIAGDSARILAGFDELERLARLESGALVLSEGSADLGAILAQMTAQLQTVLAPRMAGFILDDASVQTAVIALNEDDAEAMIWRIMATLAGSCAVSEKLQADIEIRGAEAVVTWEMPALLKAEDEPFAADIKPTSGGLSAGLFGAGFSLRLARAEARGVGGGLLAKTGSIKLTLPLVS